LALDLGGHKQRALLALLSLEANRVVSSDRLIDALWDQHPTPTAQKALQVYVSGLRKLLGKERVQTKPPGYVLRVEPDEFDLARFRRFQAEGRLQEALALWRGAPLAEFAFDRFAQAEISRLEELRLVCLEERIERDLARGRHGALVGELEALTNEHPLREQMLAQLLLALYRSGRQAEALETYQTARRAFVDELGIEPGKSLRELHRAILRQDPGLDLSAAPGPAAEAARGAFVGREAELAELFGGLDSAIAGRGCLFLLVGEPGIGKSRLADELIAEARARDARVLVGRCWEAGGAPVYWPWVQSLRAYVRASDATALRTQLGAGAADLAQILPELRRRLTDLPEPALLESEGARFRLFDATAEFLRAASESRPIVLVLDDLHAADAPSLLLLQFLARELASTHVLIVGAARDLDPIPDEHLNSVLAALAREPVTRQISLRGLSRKDVEHYVALTASELASPELAVALHAQTEGNPLFVGETVRLLAVETRPANSIDGRLAIPQSVRDVIGSRLRRLSAECNRVLTLAAVLGREFELDALAHATSLLPESLLVLLDEAGTARVVSHIPSGSGGLRFAHAMIRDTLYEGLPPGRRTQLHQQVGTALEALYADDDEPHLAELAHHFLEAARAGSKDKAIEYAHRAGDRAARLLAYEEAARFYRAALGLVEDQVVRCRLLLALGEAHARAGDGDAARTTFVRAADEAKALGAADLLARAALGYGGRIVWSRATDDRLVPLLEDALVALGEQDSPLRARVLGRLAGGAVRGRVTQARREDLALEAVETARRTGDEAALAYALDGLAACLLRPDRLEADLAVAAELVEIADRIGDRERSFQGRLYSFVALINLGRIDVAEAEFVDIARLAEELRQPTQLWQLTANRVLIALFAGRLEDAEMLIERALDYGRDAQTRDAELSSRVHTYTLRREQGRLEEVESILERSADEYPDRPMFRCLLTHVSAELGKEQAARRLLRALARDDFAAVPFDDEWLYSMSVLAEACALVRDVESAAALYAQLLPYVGRNAASPPEGLAGSVARYLGLLASVEANWDRATSHFEEALELNGGMGARPWSARTECDYAAALMARGAPADLARAAELLEAALATSRELGLQALEFSASSKLSELAAVR
jgi:DNA-binding SARP family transcriptional activator/tetratricopeptide (TPR) repeat protein